MIRVLIVDGQDEVRRGLRMRLDIERDVAIVGETGKAGEALYLAQALDPDVIVVDIGMRGAEGVNIVKRLRVAAPAAAVVVLTLHGDKDTAAAGAGSWRPGIPGESLEGRRPAAGHPPARSIAVLETGHKATGPLAARRLGVG